VKTFKAFNEHHNNFLDVPSADTCALPCRLLDKLAGEDKLTWPSVYLYLFLLGQREPKIEIHTKEILYATGLARNTLTTAREQLAKANLVKSEEAGKTRPGVWVYELLSPGDGSPLPTREQVTFSSLSDDIVMRFYYDSMPNLYENGAFLCPFCPLATNPKFVVNFAMGDSLHGTWRCQKCEAYGGMIAFYMKAYRCEVGTATRRVRAKLQALVAEEANVGPLKMPSHALPVDFGPPQPELI
jgi:hypothetical protein